MQKQQYEVTTILPLYTNNGRLQEASVNKLVNRILDVSQGGAMWKQTGIEKWDDGSVYTDASMRVITNVDTQEQVSAIRAIAIDAIDILHQRGGIMFQYHSVTVEYLCRDDMLESEAIAA